MSLMPCPTRPVAGPYTAEAFYVVAPGSDQPIAIVDELEQLSDGQAAGTARLLAASWQLLTACRQARQALAACARNHLLAEAVLQVLDEAIAGAEGKSR